jgi:long-subunit acyl-CoA synthetase (AMP-forming)
MIHEDDSSYSVLPWSHCYGLVCELLFLITRGARLYLPENNPQKDMTTFHPSLLFTVPYMLDRVLKSLPLISNKMFWRITSPIFRRHIFGKRMRSLSIGGAACDPAMIDECEKKLGVRIFQGYGMTEASPMIALNTLRHYHPSSVGKILPNIDIQIGSDNEILVSGDNIVSSLPQDRYISRDDGRIYLRTGDCGHVDGNGFLYITGRIHDHFKLPNGLYIHPNAIEQLYHKMYRPSYVLQWAIIPHPHNPSRLMMVGLCEKDASLVKIDMNKIVSIGKESHLKSYEIPIDVVCVMAHDFLTEKYTVRRSPLHQYLIKRISSHIGGPPS